MSSPARVATALRALRELAAQVTGAGVLIGAALPDGPVPAGALVPVPGLSFATAGPAEPVRPGAGAGRPLFSLAAEAPESALAASRAEEPVATDPARTDPFAAVVPVEQEHAEIWSLVQRAQAGDGEAFGALYDRYVDLVYRFIYARVHDRTLAEDFTSETFLRALRRISSFSYQGRDVGAWFVTIARNIVFDHAKSARFRLEVTLPDLLDGDETAPSPEAAMLDAFQSSTLRAAIAELNDEQRECIVLRFLQGMSVSETAAAMGKNEGAVKALQYRAVKRLASLVGDTLR